VRRPVLLDASFLIALEREVAERRPGAATALLPALRSRQLIVSVVTVAEVLEGAADDGAALTSLHRFSVQGVHLVHAQRCALIQRRSRRRMGENDSWLVATAEILDADVVGADRTAFERLGERYLRFR
jgi:predicted nucleic acid-binding protein